MTARFSAWRRWLVMLHGTFCRHEELVPPSAARGCSIPSLAVPAAARLPSGVGFRPEQTIPPALLWTLVKTTADLSCSCRPACHHHQRRPPSAPKTHSQRPERRSRPASASSVLQGETCRPPAVAKLKVETYFVCLFVLGNNPRGPVLEPDRFVLSGRRMRS